MNRAIVPLWAILALAIFGQEDRSAPCLHSGGRSTPIDLDRVERVYRTLVGEFLIQAEEASPRLELRFDSRLPRIRIEARMVELPAAVAPWAVGSQLIVGRGGFLTSAAGPDDLVGASGLATPAFARFFRLEGFPAKITIKDSRHAWIEPLD